MKKLLIVSALLALTASFASAEGINLSWNDCGVAGLGNQAFACNTNSGAPFVLYASFLPPAGGLPEFLGVSARMDVKNNGNTTVPGAMADWWMHGSAAVCRGATAMSSSFDFLAGPFSCADFYQGQAAGGFLYQTGGFPTLVGPDRATLLVQCAVPDGLQGVVDEGTEYYALKMTILRTKTTGTGSCTGCNTPTCIVLNEIQLFQPAQFNNDPKINLPADRNFVTFQAAAGDCPAATPTTKSSWGQVKSLYR